MLWDLENLRCFVFWNVESHVNVNRWVRSAVLSKNGKFSSLPNYVNVREILDKLFSNILIADVKFVAFFLSGSSVQHKQITKWPKERKTMPRTNIQPSWTCVSLTGSWRPVMICCNLPTHRIILNTTHIPTWVYFEVLNIKTPTTTSTPVLIPRFILSVFTDYTTKHVWKAILQTVLDR